MQAVLLTVVVAGYALATYLSHRSEAEEAAGGQATSVARSVADSPSVREAIRSSDPSARLQPYAVAVVRDTDVDFVTIMDPRGIRWTHPDPAQIGLPFRGHTGPALKGRTFTETYTGTLGPSVRAVTPCGTATGSSAWSARAYGSRRSAGGCRSSSPRCWRSRRARSGSARSART